MKKLIISADDFGLTEGINRGIIECARNGTVTSASIMVNTPAFPQAAALAGECPALDIGVHLNLVKGKPLLTKAEIPSLVNTAGNFYTLPPFTLRLFTGRINLIEAEKELRAQLGAALKAGLKITHLDSHRHFHTYPAMLKLIIKIAKDYHIGAIRCPLGLTAIPGGVKEGILNCLSRNASARLDAARVRHNDRFFELVRIESKKDYLGAMEKFCANLGDAVTELDTHPGYMTGDLDGIEATIHNRERQVKILTDPALTALLKKYDIGLLNYGAIV
jgi:chitin disaccharide deacetylase